MRKTWWIAIHGVLIVILGLIAIDNLIQTSKLDECNNQLIDLYQNESRTFFYMLELYGDMHFHHTLSLEASLVKNDLDLASDYINQARGKLGKLNSRNWERNDISDDIKEKIEECNVLKLPIKRRLTFSFLGYLILILISLIIYQKTKK